VDTAALFKKQSFLQKIKLCSKVRIWLLKCYILFTYLLLKRGSASDQNSPFTAGSGSQCALKDGVGGGEGEWSVEGRPSNHRMLSRNHYCCQLPTLGDAFPQYFLGQCVIFLTVLYRYIVYVDYRRALSLLSV
jgi:hypothetical protein